MEQNSEKSLIDASRLMIEGVVQSGADAFVGYPITPANLLYSYSSARFPMVLPAPDEISTVQWMSGLSAAGKIPVTATSYPGFALMIESIGMAFMMELPMVIILVQRLGPSTGTATCGAQGDILSINGINSGGYPIPTLCPSSFEDCFSLSAKAVQLAVNLRSPVILLSSKEMVMTLKSFDPSSLDKISPVKRKIYDKKEIYRPYKADEKGIPDFLPVGSENHQVRITASTHNSSAELQHSTREALDNSRRLRFKTEHNLSEYTEYHYKRENSDTLLFSYGISSAASREAAANLKAKGKKVSLLIAKTLFPVPPDYIQTADGYSKVFIVEENQNGHYREVLFGKHGRQGVYGINAIGRMIAPSEIEKEFLK